MRLGSAFLPASALLLLCCHSALAQITTTGRPVPGGLGMPFPTGPGQTAAGKPAPEARAFGNEGQLPGSKIADVKDIQRKWYYRETRNNVVIDGVRVPRRATTMMLELKPDGSYALTYEVYWGLARDEPSAQQAGLVAKESGRYSLSGSILLLEAEPFDVIEQSRFDSKRRSIPAEKRAYIVRLQGEQLNIAGPCAAYQVETVCATSRTVWFAMSTPVSRAPLTIGTRR